MKAIFDTKPTSVYDDKLSQHYHFPKRYLTLVKQCIGDWVILRRPRADGGDLAYFATAQISHVEPDLTISGMSYARFSNYMEFDEAVPWKLNGRYAEEALRNIPRSEVGVYLRGRSVRLISDEDFIALIASGFKETFDPQVGDWFGLPSAPIVEVARAVFEAEADSYEKRARRIGQALTNRIVRDANFRRSVCAAYNSCCAVTGLRITDECGRPEAQAAHIQAVADDGPDVVQNGIALSGTLHWMFDRHLISLTDDCRLLIAKQRVPTKFRRLFVGEGEQILLPTDRKRWPHPTYIAKHRASFLDKNNT